MKNIQQIQYREYTIPLFYHPHNCGMPNDERTTERTIELALADFWLTRIDDQAMEIGAVTPYYFPGRISEIVDPADQHPLVSQKESLFSVDMRGKNILSISTLEHIGTHDYNKISAKEDGVAALHKIMARSNTFLITFPLGYNLELQEHVGNTLFGRSITVSYYYRSKSFNDWKYTRYYKTVKNIDYGPLWANALAVIEKQ